MKAKTRVLPNPEAVGAYVADKLLQRIDAAKAAGKGFLLGSPTGRTPKPIYAAMVERLQSGTHDLSHVTLVIMDEYLVQGEGELEYASDNEPWSCHSFSRPQIVDVLNAALQRERRMRHDAIWFPDLDDPPNYDRRIVDAGGVDFFILASGASDGHVAFNLPGSARDSRSRVVPLSDVTRRDSLNTFPAFGTLDAVPKHGITVGVETITSAKEAVMVVMGTGKRQTFARMRASTAYDPTWPATLIHECKRAEIVADAEAAAQ